MSQLLFTGERLHADDELFAIDVVRHRARQQHRQQRDEHHEPHRDTADERVGGADVIIHLVQRAVCLPLLGVHHHDVQAVAAATIGDERPAKQPLLLPGGRHLPEALGIDVGDLAALGIDAEDYATAKEAAAAAKKAANKKADKALRDQDASLAPWCFLAWQAVDRTPKKAGQAPRNL